MEIYKPEKKSYKLKLADNHGEVIIQEINLPLALLRLYSHFGYQEVESIEEIKENGQNN